jgi:hypothetical protein
MGDVAYAKTLNAELSTINFPLLELFYETDRPTKNALEKRWIETTREKTGAHLIWNFSRRPFLILPFYFLLCCSPSAFP